MKKGEVRFGADRTKRIQSHRRLFIGKNGPDIQVLLLRQPQARDPDLEHHRDPRLLGRRDRLRSVAQVGNPALGIFKLISDLHLMNQLEPSREVQDLWGGGKVASFSSRLTS